MNAFASNISSSPEPGEIWLAKFSFDERDGRYKVRPVFVLTAYPYGVSVAFCGTKQMETTSKRTDVLLNDEEAQRLGMREATRICFGRRETLSLTAFLRRLGEIGAPGVHLGYAKFDEIAQAVRAAGMM